MNERIRERSTRRILKAASKVIAKKGMSATMSEMAAEAGISQGLAYRYFPSKDAIFYALLREVLDSGGVSEATPEGPRGSPGQRLERIVADIIQLRRQHPEFYQFVFQALMDERLPADIRNAIGARGSAARSTIRQLVVEGQRLGEIVDEDPDQLVDALMGCIEGLSLRMAHLPPDEARASLPEPRIILRMLRPDRSGELRP